MDARTITMRRGLRMALQVAALSTAAGALGAAATATEAQADVGGAALGSTSVAGVDGVAGPSESMQVKGWSCWGAPISRGPLAPPPQGATDFEALLAEVPS